MKLSGRLQDIFVEDFRKELAEMQTPEAKHLFILAKANQLMQLHLGEYVALIAAADVTGHYGVGVLLESCLADKLAFMERTQRFIRERRRELKAGGGGRLSLNDNIALKEVLRKHLNGVGAE